MYDVRRIRLTEPDGVGLSVRGGGSHRSFGGDVGAEMTDDVHGDFGPLSRQGFFWRREERRSMQADTWGRPVVVGFCSAYSAWRRHFNNADDETLGRPFPMESELVLISLLLRRAFLRIPVYLF